MRNLMFIAALLWPARAEKAPTSRLVEIRSYSLKPGTRDRFHRLFLAQALPMLQRWKVDVVAYGPSLHDGDSYYLMRAYAGLEERQRSEDAFYGSDEWRRGPREAILADIESYTTIVLRLDEATLRGLRKTPQSPEVSDETQLRKLNEQYVEAFMKADVSWYREHLADDFVCIESNGSILGKTEFLRETAQGPGVTSYRLEEVKVRIQGAAADVALVQATGRYTRRDGTTGTSHYIDVYVRRDGKWKTVSAQITRRSS